VERRDFLGSFTAVSLGVTLRTPESFNLAIEPPQPSMSNTIVLIRNRPSESNALCCIYGPKVARSTPSMQQRAVRLVYGDNGRRTCKDSQ
jgi:hypothetical protein